MTDIRTLQLITLHTPLTMESKYFNRFEEIEKIGEGAFGRVFKVADENCEISALKIYRAKVQKYIRPEWDVYDLIDGPNPSDCLAERNYCLGKIDYFVVDRRYGLQMAILPKDLFDFITRPHENTKYIYKFDLDELQHITFQLCSALKYLHALNIIHNDLKPENILLCDISLDKKFRLRRCDIRLTDFGHALLPGAKFDSYPTEQYCAPEIVLKNDRWTVLADMWSLGCILAELYYGKLLFDLDIRKTRTMITANHLRMIYYFTGKRMAKSTEGKLSTPKAFEPLRNHKSTKNEIDGTLQFMSLVKRMLEPFARDRITARNSLEMPFLKHFSYNKRYIRPKVYNRPNNELFLYRVKDLEAVSEPPVLSCLQMTTLKRCNIEKSINLLVMSDLHGRWNVEYIRNIVEINHIDAFVFAGDIILNTGNEKANFNCLLETAKSIREIGAFVQTYIVAGNHDAWSLNLTRFDIDAFFAPAVFIENECFTFKGIRFFGTPMTACDNLAKIENFARYNPHCLNPYGNVPKNTDVIITHGGPLGMQSYMGVQYGDHHLRRLIDDPNTNLKAVLFGHMHNNMGFRVINHVVCLNASQMTGASTLDLKPFILKIVN
ncbi:calcineurin-like phosphoesterase-like protein [Tomelloso virus]|uniref:Calcineurin-like phosphoesterase-like protein n=1 Tax=Tomelloso virus TaxID=2053981 RepID=A0A2H4T2P5_9VIRU|nr:calcineurin-like phosphoesterase-like protein [Tomelloso virus]ATY70186.1 calcineurin-like phosphoesterase-like protein [Tomelloso virus]